MNSKSEIDVLKTVIDSLTPLDSNARARVLEYVSKVFDSPIERAATGESGVRSSVGQDRTSKQIGPQEYLRKYKYKSMTKKIGVMAVFLERERGMNRVAFQVLQKEFKDAKEPKLPVHMQFTRAVASNYLAKDGESYYATSAAEALVDTYRPDADELDTK